MIVIITFKSQTGLDFIIKAAAARKAEFLGADMDRAFFIIGAESLKFTSFQAPTMFFSDYIALGEQLSAIEFYNSIQDTSPSIRETIREFGR